MMLLLTPENVAALENLAALHADSTNRLFPVALANGMFVLDEDILSDSTLYAVYIPYLQQLPRVEKETLEFRQQIPPLTGE